VERNDQVSRTAFPEHTVPRHTHRLAELCKAMGHPARVSIVNHLKRIDGCVCGRLVEALPLAQSTVSQHLKILKEAGLVRGEIEGPRTCYCLNPNVLEEFRVLTAGLMEGCRSAP
jgi:ArsR family transcriptional regulator